MVTDTPDPFPYIGGVTFILILWREISLMIHMREPRYTNVHRDLCVNLCFFVCVCVSASVFQSTYTHIFRNRSRPEQTFFISTSPHICCFYGPKSFLCVQMSKNVCDIFSLAYKSSNMPKIIAWYGRITLHVHARFAVFTESVSQVNNRKRRLSTTGKLGYLTSRVTAKKQTLFFF